MKCRGTFDKVPPGAGDLLLKWNGIVDKVPPGTVDLLHASINNSQTPRYLPPTLGKDHEFKMIGKFLPSGKRRPPKELQKEFPEVDLLILLSRVRFNDSEDSAVVQIERWGLCNYCRPSGRSYLLKKTNNRWEIVGVVSTAGRKINNTAVRLIYK